jgi:hypothetical protein
LKPLESFVPSSNYDSYAELQKKFSQLPILSSKDAAITKNLKLNIIQHKTRHADSIEDDMSISYHSNTNYSRLDYKPPQPAAIDDDDDARSYATQDMLLDDDDASIVLDTQRISDLRRTLDEQLDREGLLIHSSQQRIPNSQTFVRPMSVHSTHQSPLSVHSTRQSPLSVHNTRQSPLSVHSMRQSPLSVQIVRQSSVPVTTNHQSPASVNSNRQSPASVHSNHQSVALIHSNHDIQSAASIHRNRQSPASVHRSHQSVASIHSNRYIQSAASVHSGFQPPMSVHSGFSNHPPVSVHDTKPFMQHTSQSPMPVDDIQLDDISAHELSDAINSQNDVKSIVKKYKGKAKAEIAPDKPLVPSDFSAGDDLMNDDNHIPVDTDWGDDGYGWSDNELE